MSGFLIPLAVIGACIGVPTLATWALCRRFPVDQVDEG